MKKVLWVAAGAAGLLVVLGSAAGCSRQVHPGNVGVLVSNWDRTRASRPSPWAWASISPASARTSTNTRSIRAPTLDVLGDRAERVNEEFTFQDKNGLSVSADVAVAL